MLVLVAFVFIAGCSPARQAGNTGATIEFDVEHARVGVAQVDVTISDNQGRSISGAEVQLRGDMTHAGMQPVIASMQELGDGRYRSDNFEFTMAGDWVLTVEATLPDGARAMRMFEVRGVEGGSE